jgi:hypothetical protein
MPFPLNYYQLNAQIADVGTASTVYFSAPQAGWLREVTTTLFAAITGANDVITVAVDGTTVGTITVTQSGSAAGDVDSIQLNAPVKKGSRITCANSGASTGTAPLAYTLTLSG